jgi:hypothetical protein
LELSRVKIVLKCARITFTWFIMSSVKLHLHYYYCLERGNEDKNCHLKISRNLILIILIIDVALSILMQLGSLLARITFQYYGSLESSQVKIVLKCARITFTWFIMSSVKLHLHYYCLERGNVDKDCHLKISRNLILIILIIDVALSILMQLGSLLARITFQYYGSLELSQVKIVLKCARITFTWFIMSSVKLHLHYYYCLERGNEDKDCHLKISKNLIPLLCTHF